MTEGLLDTSVVIDWDDPDVAAALHDDAAISAITLAELAADPHLATAGDERARRQARIQQVEATFEPVPFGSAVARSYGQVSAAVAEMGRSTAVGSPTRSSPPRLMRMAWGSRRV